MKNNHHRFLSIALGLLLCLSISGCFLRPYRFTVTQGNEICADTVAQIQPGMSCDEVRYILGTPMLQDIFHENRWDYIYIEKPGYAPAERCHLAVFFDNGVVTQVMQDQLPAQG